jgi:peptidoglycan/LPS O-acetylase OafA/YrhL
MGKCVSSVFQEPTMIRSESLLRRWTTATAGFLLAMSTAVAEAQDFSDRRYQGGGAGSAILGALICGYIASSKNRNPWGFALLGFVCCPCGIIVALLAAPGPPRE